MLAQGNGRSEAVGMRLMRLLVDHGEEGREARGN